MGLLSGDPSPPVGIRSKDGATVLLNTSPKSITITKWKVRRGMVVNQKAVLFLYKEETSAGMFSNSDFFVYQCLSNVTSDHICFLCT